MRHPRYTVGHDTGAIQAWMGHEIIQHSVRYTEIGSKIFGDKRGTAMGWSMDRKGIRTLFDGESKRLKQLALSGPRRERVSLDTYPDELAARDAEFRQEARYAKWSEPASNSTH